VLLDAQSTSGWILWEKTITMKAGTEKTTWGTCAFQGRSIRDHGGNSRDGRKSKMEGGEEAMTVLKMAALVLAINAAIGVIGVLTFGHRADDVVRRPTWLPPLWVRGAIPLAVAVALWFGQPWAWWVAVAMSIVMVARTTVASSMLAFGGFFAERTASRIVYIGSLAVTWIGVLALLLSA
jgi:hypothetical protein